MYAKLPNALCAQCPLKDHPCVPAKTVPAPVAAIVGEGPGKQEAEDGQPFVGPSGKLVDLSLHAAGIQRSRLHITNATACYPEGRKLTGKEWNEAINACKPRLLAELSAISPEAAPIPVIAFGGKALQALTGKTSIMAWFGYPIPDVRIQGGVNGKEINVGQTFPIFHPALALRQSSLLDTFKQQVFRAGRWLSSRDDANDGFVWKWPVVHTVEGADALRVLASIQRSGHYGFDVETAGEDPLAAPLLTVAFGSKDAGAVSIRWPFKLDATYDAVRALLRDKSCRAYAHNAAHDILSLETAGFSIEADVHDTLLLHAAKHPQLPHSLSFVSATMFPAPRWKSDFHDEGEDKGAALFVNSPIESLQIYNAKDAWMTDLVGERLLMSL